VNDIPNERVKPKTSLWVSAMTVAAGVAIVALAASTIHYRDLYVETLDRLRKADFRRRTLEEDSSNFRHRRADSAGILQLVPTLTLAEVEEYQNKGLWDPYDDIANDLINHPELLSPAAPEGGPPLLARENICVLGPDRVLAFFKHGSGEGRMLASYAVSDDGEISWEVVEAVAVE
jgi:hypothetical protein